MDLIVWFRVIKLEMVQHSLSLLLLTAGSRDACCRDNYNGRPSAKRPIETAKVPSNSITAQTKWPDESVLPIRTQLAS